MNFVESGFVHSGYFIRESDTEGNFRFDGLAKKIFVNAGVTSVTIEDMYSRWIDWSIKEDNLKWPSAMRVSGKDPIPNGFTGSTFFTINGWKVVYDANLTAVSGVLYSEDFATAYSAESGSPIYPATVSALVLSSGGGVVPTAEAVALAVWSAIVESGITAEQALRLILAVQVGDATGLESANPIFKSIDGSKDRVNATYVNGVRVINSKDVT